MLAELETDQWPSAFGPDGARTDTNVMPAAPGYAIPTNGFSCEDVTEILHLRAGENDGEHWLLAGRLADGRFFFLSAWCDYTGFGCQSGGEVSVAHTYEDLVQFAINDDDRAILGIPQPKDRTT